VCDTVAAGRVEHVIPAGDGNQQPPAIIVAGPNGILLPDALTV
jgi:hypothetical protein